MALPVYIPDRRNRNRYRGRQVVYTSSDNDGNMSAATTGTEESPMPPTAKRDKSTRSSKLAEFSQHSLSSLIDQSPPGSDIIGASSSNEGYDSSTISTASSFAQPRSFMDVHREKMMKIHKLTPTQAVINLCNVGIGVGVLAKPYAFALGGFKALLSLVIANLLCCYSGALLGKVVTKHLKELLLHSTMGVVPDYSYSQNVDTSMHRSPTDTDTTAPTTTITGVIPMVEPQSVPLTGDPSQTTSVSPPKPSVDPPLSVQLKPTPQKSAAALLRSKIASSAASLLTTVKAKASALAGVTVAPNGSDTQQTLNATRRSVGSYRSSYDDYSIPVSGLPHLNSEQRRKLHKTTSVYPALAYKTLGRFGKHLTTFILGFSVCLWIATGIIMCWLLCLDMIHHFDNDESSHIFFIDNEKITFVFVVLISLPTSLALTWKEITWFAYIGIISIIAIAGSIIILTIHCVVNLGGKPPMHQIPSNNSNVAKFARQHISGFDEFLVAFTLFLLGISCSFALPNIHVDLRKPKQYPTVMYTSYAIVTVFYLIIGVLGYWLYGGYTHILLLNNMFVWPGGILPVLLSIAVLLNIIATFGITIAIVSDLVEKSFGIENDSRMRRRTLRCCLFILISIVSYYARQHYAFLVVLQGAVQIIFSISLSIPILMYLSAFWKKLIIYEKIFHCCMLLLALWVGIMVFRVDLMFLY